MRRGVENSEPLHLGGADPARGTSTGERVAATVTILLIASVAVIILTYVARA